MYNTYYLNKLEFFIKYNQNKHQFLKHFYNILFFKKYDSSYFI